MSLWWAVGLIIAGTVLVVAFAGWLAFVPTLVIVPVAIVTTKIPVLLGPGFWGFAVRDAEIGHVQQPASGPSPTPG